MDCSTPHFPVLYYLPEFAQTHVHWVNDELQPSHPLQHPSLPALSLSQHWDLLQWVSCLHQVAKILELHLQWPKYWSFTFSISPSNDYSGLISFRIDWFDLFVVQGTLKSLLHHDLKVSVLQHSAFFMVQFSHLYMTTRKNIVLTTWTIVSKVMSLLFNMLLRVLIGFLPRSKCFEFHGCSHCLH